MSRVAASQELDIVSPSGVVHKVAEWSTDVSNRESRALLDWSPDGRHALLSVVERELPFRQRLIEIDLESGIETELFDNATALYPRPTGKALLVARSSPDPDTTLTLERRTRAGELLGELRNGDRNFSVPPVLSVGRGTKLAFSTNDGIVVTTNTGARPRELLRGQGRCRPVRRWPDDHLLVSCFDVLDTGYRSTLWDLNLATSRLRRIGADPCLTDAMVVSGRTWVASDPECSGGAGLRTLSSDNKTLTAVAIESSANAGSCNRIAGRDPATGNLVVRSPLACTDGDGGWLGVVDKAGRRVRILLDGPASSASREIGLVEAIAFDELV